MAALELELTEFVYDDIHAAFSLNEDPGLQYALDHPPPPLPRPVSSGGQLAVVNVAAASANTVANAQSTLPATVATNNAGTNNVAVANLTQAGVIANAIANAAAFAIAAQAGVITNTAANTAIAQVIASVQLTPPTAPIATVQPASSIIVGPSRAPRRQPLSSLKRKRTTVRSVQPTTGPAEEPIAKRTRRGCLEASKGT